jgi:hypothetical protein
MNCAGLLKASIIVNCEPVLASMIAIFPLPMTAA